MHILQILCLSEKSGNLVHFYRFRENQVVFFLTLLNGHEKSRNLF